VVLLLAQARVMRGLGVKKPAPVCGLLLFP